MNIYRALDTLRTPHLPPIMAFGTDTAKLCEDRNHIARIGSYGTFSLLQVTTKSGAKEECTKSLSKQQISSMGKKLKDPSE